MKSIWLVGAAIISITSASASSDTLDLVRTAFANGVTSQAAEDKTPEPVEKVGFYFQANVGVNFISNVKINGQSATMNFDPGVDSSFSFGYQVLEWLGLEAQTGVAWNEARDFPQNYGLTLWQVPVMGNVKFIIPLSRPESERWPFIGVTAYLDFNAGVGALWTQARYTIPGQGTHNNSWAFAYQVGTNLRMAITHNFDMGVYFNFRGTTTVTLETNVKAKELFNYGLGLTFRVSF